MASSGKFRVWSCRLILIGFSIFCFESQASFCQELLSTLRISRRPFNQSVLLKYNDVSGIPSGARVEMSTPDDVTESVWRDAILRNREVSMIQLFDPNQELFSLRHVGTVTTGIGLRDIIQALKLFTASQDATLVSRVRIIHTHQAHTFMFDRERGWAYGIMTDPTYRIRFSQADIAIAKNIRLAMNMLGFKNADLDFDIAIPSEMGTPRLNMPVLQRTLILDHTLEYEVEKYISPASLKNIDKLVHE